MNTVSGYRGSGIIPDYPSVSDVVDFLRDAEDNFDRSVLSFNWYDYDNVEDYRRDLEKCRLKYVDNFPYFNDFVFILNQHTVAHDLWSSEYDCDAQYAYFEDLASVRDELLRTWNGCGFTVNGRNIYEYDDIYEYFTSLGIERVSSLIEEVLSPTSEFCPFWDDMTHHFSCLDIAIKEYYDSHNSQINEYYRIKESRRIKCF